MFAQEPLFSSPDDAVAGPNFSLLKDATLRHNVTVIGSAPYVESTIEQAKMNIGLIFDIADACNVDYVDFHLDYNLDPSSELLIYEVIAQLKRRFERSRDLSQGLESSRKGGKGPTMTCPRITIGHATRLQLFTPTQWWSLVEAISDLPITFVGLPQSDIFMQGRAFNDTPLGAPRGTLRIPYIAKKYGVQIAMSVNNIDNAFTPQGSLDPLSLCTFGVAVFQTATPEDIRTLVVGLFLFLPPPFSIFSWFLLHDTPVALFQFHLDYWNRLLIFYLPAISDLDLQERHWYRSEDPCRLRLGSDTQCR